MHALLRPAALLAGLAAVAALDAPAAERKDIDAAVRKGADYLKQRFRGGGPGGAHGVGPAALAGLALLENGVPADDPAVKAITAAVRDATYSQVSTYQISLCLLYLDRLGDRADGPLIQMLAVRLLAGQNARGGWGYECIDEVPPQQERELRTRLDARNLVAGGGNAPRPPAKDGPGRPGVAGTLHPEVERYHEGLLVARRGRNDLLDDNSNTQFAILAVWVARRHGVPVEDALELIEKRFLATQNPQTGGWPYSGGLGDGSASMTCAGLLGLATAVARREERLNATPLPKGPPPKAPAPKSDPKPDTKPKSDDPFFNPPGKSGMKSDDPFFNPPVRPAPAPPKKVAPQGPGRPRDGRDLVVERGLANLGVVLNQGRGGNGRIVINPKAAVGDRDLYFLWSLERVGVVYGLDKIGGVDWYQYGADLLIPAQNADGSWGARGGYGPEVDTAFALLFLARSNLVRDLSTTVQRNLTGAELRSGGDGPFASGPPPGSPSPPPPKTDSKADVEPPLIPPPAPPSVPASPPSSTPPAGPAPASDDATRIAADLLRADDWARALEAVRDAKGADNTRALLLVIAKADSPQKQQARDALAERLTRMTADTLRAMLKSDEVELRRAAVLACAMKDDKAHVPDLIDRLLDDEEAVVRAARAGLKSLTAQDFGPAPGADRDARIISAAAWRTWWTRKGQ
jgi:hypothetical protein